ncbi:hypothetical protein BJ138DRAFT_1118985 [Hygrophoropsis aurantiaca]|uniref:Uncharacterized protein n=1 Tax=Hygrophoropsis aurantiaca TaxID=72124 RepID=A0ACB7ZUW9_9AGAM|nr:hypothetical protein BJ138DRAFT_1118985 [Hygrophoropsis aurantiaca]
MTENERGSSQTIHSSSGSSLQLPEEQIQQSLDIIETFRQGHASFDESVGALQESISSAIPSDASSTDRQRYNQGLRTYIDALQRATEEHNDAKIRGKQREPVDRSDEVNGNRGTPDIDNASHASRHRSITPSIYDDADVSYKRRRVDESMFPWNQSEGTMPNIVDKDLKRAMDLLDNWSGDPKLVKSKILLAPGCPDFPPDQWLNIVQGLPVDLDKVLTSHYSTETEEKQTQDIGLFQVSLKVAKASRIIVSQADWSMAHYKLICAASFAFPWLRSMYMSYHD